MLPIINYPVEQENQLYEALPSVYKEYSKEQRIALYKYSIDCPEEYHRLKDKIINNNMQKSKHEMQK